MKISDIMTRGVDVIHPNATLKEAAQKMDDINVGALPVCDGDRVVGLITDRDIVIRSVSAGQDPNSTRVQDAMTSPINFCFEDQDVREVASILKDKQIRRLPVLSRDKKLIGIVSLGDIAVDAKDRNLSAELLEDVSKPAKPAA